MVPGRASRLERTVAMIRTDDPLTLKSAEQLRAARVEAMAGRYQQAAELSRAAVANHPNALLALRILAWAELELGQPTARDRFEACLRIDPEDAIAEVGLGILAEAQSRVDEARQHFARAFELDPTDEHVRAQLGRLGGELPTSQRIEGLHAARAGDLAGAATCLREASASDPPDPAARLALATVIWQLGAREQIENICQDVLATDPHCLKAQLYLLALAVDRKRSLQIRDLQARVGALDPGGMLSADLLAPIDMAERALGPRT